jgi:hypothetical protein
MTMPWAKFTYERTVEAYKDVLEDTLLNHQKDIDLIVKELLFRAEVLKHDFTKRQLFILSMIVTFSYNYGKDYAYIPKLQDFELAGISKKHIRNELDKLIEMNVICENKEENVYSIIEPRFWKNVPYNAGYNDDRSRELFLLNLDHAGIDVSPIVQKLKQMEE